MEQHAKNCASKRPMYDGDMRIISNFRKGKCDCDGYHTFKELYDHRITLFIALCRILYNDPQYQTGRRADVWRSKKHSDGELAFGGAWFVLGIGREQGEQITYHLPIERWEETDFAETREQAPEFDGHTSEDVLQRLKEL